MLESGLLILMFLMNNRLDDVLFSIGSNLITDDSLVNLGGDGNNMYMKKEPWHPSHGDTRQ